jgi:hypothetical protein
VRVYIHFGRNFKYLTHNVKLGLLTIGGKHRLRVFENRVLRRIFRLKGDDVTGGLRKLHNEELHNLYSLPNIIRTIKSRSMRLAGHVVRILETRNAYRVLMGKATR